MRIKTNGRSVAITTALVVLVSTAIAADPRSMRNKIEQQGLNTAIQIGDGVTANPMLAAADTNPHGQPYGVLGANWWQWIFSLPVHDAQNNITHPLLTSGAVNCSIGQSGSVWFLTGNITGGATSRTCTVPRNTSLFFPIVNSWCDNTGFDTPGNLTLPQLEACAAFFSAPLSQHASVDGVPVVISASNRGQAPFEYTVPNQDNLLQYFGALIPGPGWPFGNTPFGVHVAPAISDGTWLLVPPLAPGPHIINFGGTAQNGGFSLDITYNLTVN